LTKGGPYLLFYWATWCKPCKAALPEVLAFERERNTKVISITDETPRQLKKFFAQWQDPFPEIVGWDELRQSFLAYAVSGTPAFVLIDAEGRIEKAWTGYRATDGLKIPGWTWSPQEQKDGTVLTIDGLEIPGATPSQGEQNEKVSDE
jgi:peroxiredoxin